MSTLAGKSPKLDSQFNAVARPPEGWQGDLSFTNRLGQRVRYGFAPAYGEPADSSAASKGTVVLTHGYGETVDLYYEAIRKFQDEGYNVWAMDWQGHGLSDRDDPANPRRPSTKGLLRHVHDLDYFVNHIVDENRDRNKPLIMNTHSMGGHIGLLYLQKFPGVFDAAVMSAPMFDIYRLGLPAGFRPLVRFVFNAAAKLGLQNVAVPGGYELLRKIDTVGKGLRDIAKDTLNLRDEIIETIREKLPAARLDRPSFGWIAAAYNTIIPSTRDDFLRSINTPVLIGAAGKEDLVDNDALRRAAELMPHGRLVNIEQSHHGLWFGADDTVNEWWGQVQNFIGGVKVADDKQNIAPQNAPIIAGDNMARTIKGRYAGLNRCPSGTHEDLLPVRPPPSCGPA